MRTAADLETALAQAESRLAAFDTGGSDDPAVARLASRALRQIHANTDRRLAEFTQLAATVDELRMQHARAVAREADAKRARLTVEDVKGSRLVRDQFGWHRVVRVSAQSVTVETPYSWTDRIPLAKILEART